MLVPIFVFSFFIVFTIFSYVHIIKPYFALTSKPVKWPLFKNKCPEYWKYIKIGNDEYCINIHDIDKDNLINMKLDKRLDDNLKNLLTVTDNKLLSQKNPKLINKKYYNIKNLDEFEYKLY